MVAKQRTWNFGFLLGRCARWVVAVLVVLPLGILIGLALAMLWLLWVGVSTLQGLLLGLKARTATHHVLPRGRIGEDRHGRRTLELPKPRRETRAASGEDTGRERRVHSLDDVRRSLAGMAVHRWPKPKVIAALRGLGAAWVWCEPVEPGAAAVMASGNSRVAGARERVHLRYRIGPSLLTRYTHPAARIDVWFDGAGRLVHASAWQDRRFL